MEKLAQSSLNKQGLIFLISQAALRWEWLAFVLWPNDIRVVISALLLALSLLDARQLLPLQAARMEEGQCQKLSSLTPHHQAETNIYLVGQNFVAWQPLAFPFSCVLFVSYFKKLFLVLKMQSQSPIFLFCCAFQFQVSNLRNIFFFQHVVKKSISPPFPKCVRMELLSRVVFSHCLYFFL